jgi:hypothetical protein
MENLKVKFSAKSDLAKPLKPDQEVEFIVRGIVSKIYHKPKSNERVFVIRVFEAENKNDQFGLR